MLGNSPDDFYYLQIGLAAPDRIRFWSYGEVEKPETINYRTFKPERKGLFCEKIFGPVKDWECACGKYRRVRYRGIVCERCGVEVTHSKVRRERMGHIELAADVAHIWFLKGIPSYMALLLDMSSREIEEVVYYDCYIVTKVDPELIGVVELGQTLSTNDYDRLKEDHGNKFEAEMGAAGIKKVFQSFDLEKMALKLREEMVVSKGQKKLKLTKRLRIVEGLQRAGNRPEWMILEAIPVMPPDLRPMVQLEGGRFATSDLNDLYRRVVNRNNRLRRLMDIGAPEMIIRNEKRMLQEAVDVLISNGKRGRSVTGSNGRPLKSLGNIIEGKQGRFRQNLLGKRVDYSGRSVIVVGPHLKFHQCGLPKEMALELFKPFVIRKLVESGMVNNVKSAKRKIEAKEVIVWDVLEEVIKGQPVLLNRAPTLHRLGIQAFEPVLVEGSAIQVHPLVCSAFNADFDGDQMAVHIPLSVEAQTECWMLIMAPNNILSPASGRAIITPTQDMVLGCYFLTFVDKSIPPKNRHYRDIYEALRAWDAKVISIQEEISVTIRGERLKTSIGRILFNQAIWDELSLVEPSRVEPFVNEVVGKKQLSKLIFTWFNEMGSYVTAHLANRIKNIGFKYSTLSGISISVADMIIPDEKVAILEKAESDIAKLEEQFSKKGFSVEEKVSRSNEIWRDVTQQVSNALERSLGELNNVYIMANSGARGNIDQVRQLAGMRGLMSDAQGRTVEIPIKSNFKEGLTITEYFISSYGARKGLVDTALRTADSGYLTRRLVDVAQDVMVTEEDCGVQEGAVATALTEGIDTIVPLKEVIEGRVALEEVKDQNGNIIVGEGDLITYKQAEKIEATGKTTMQIRSIFKCKTKRGLCQKCYGMDLSSGKLINLGEAVGIIAAQSIGEPGTQLTMRTFHTGGVDLRKASKLEFRAPFDGKLNLPKTGITLLNDKDKSFVTTSQVELELSGKSKSKVLKLPKSALFLVDPSASLKEGALIAEYDPTINYLTSNAEGIVKLIKSKTSNKNEIYIYDPENIVDYVVTLKGAAALEIGQRVRAGEELSSNVVIELGGFITNIKPVKGKEKEVSVSVCPGVGYFVQNSANLLIADGDKVQAGEVIAIEKIEDTDASKTKDIVQGLPRVEELFEARRPKESAKISPADGVVELIEEAHYTVLRVSSEGTHKDFKVAKNTRLLVHSGQKVSAGEILTEGIVSPYDILDTQGVEKAQSFLADEVQKVYRSQGVQINSKHIDVIVRQMTRKITISTTGDSELLPGELVDFSEFETECERLSAENKELPEGVNTLLGITRVSLNTDSFVSASSFQQTASVLTKAAIGGQTDPMYGLKENVIIGKLIPAGTGFRAYNHIGLKVGDKTLEEMEQELQDELSVSEAIDSKI